MTESFEDAMAFARKISDCEFGEHPNDSIREWCEMHDCGTCAACLNRLLDRLKTAHEHELEQLRKSRFHEGYVAGQHSMDAEHYAVALRLRRLPLDGDTTENLSQIARAIWHSDFGWTQGACKALRDELVRLMGGVSERPYQTSTYDVLGNERHEAVCELRNTSLETGSAIKKLAHALGVKWNPDNAPKSMGLLRDRLIHLLGEVECNFSGAESYMDATGEKGNPAETSDASTDHVSFDTPSPEDGTCPNDNETCPNPVQSASITDELGNERHKVVCRLREIRDCLKNDSTCNSLNIADAIGAKLDVGDHLHESICDQLIYLLGGDVGTSPNDDNASPNDGPTSSITNELRECVETARKSQDHCISEAELLEIADRIEEQFARVCELWERTATDTAQSVHDDMEAECNKLQAECDRLTAALDELHADPANDAICRLERECDKAHAEVLRLEFENAEWRRGAERDADKLESLTGAYNDAVAERDELREKLDELESFDPEASIAAFGDDNNKLRRTLSRAAALLVNAEQDRDANYANWMDCKAKVVQANTTIDGLQAKLEEAEFAISNWREREMSLDESERLREELRRERDELRERLDRVADALRGVERGTMSAWEAADEVGR